MEHGLEGRDLSALEGVLPIQSVIGRNVTAARETLGISQAELGERVSQYLGKPWPRQTVSAVERGDRAFSAVEVLVLAVLLETTPAMLFRLPADAVAVLVGDATVIHRSVLQSAVAPEEPAHLLVELMDQLRNVHSAVARSIRLLEGEARGPLDDMDARVTGLLSRIAGGE